MDTRAKMYFDEVWEGMDLPSATYGPMDRYKYIPIAVILRDMNPLHLDRVYARERGVPDVVQQGPLNETYLYRFLTDWLHRPWDIRKTKLRSAANVFPDDMLTCMRGPLLAYVTVHNQGVSCSVLESLLCFSESLEKITENDNFKIACASITGWPSLLPNTFIK